MRARLAVSDLTLRAAQAAMQHEGARGYVLGASAQYRLREAQFVAIITPSMKHLRREVARRTGHSVPNMARQVTAAPI